MTNNRLYRQIKREYGLVTAHITNVAYRDVVIKSITQKAELYLGEPFNHTSFDKIAEIENIQNSLESIIVDKDGGD